MKKYWWLFSFGIAMGYLEAAVVVYLRDICCPSGFSFPLQMPATHIYLTELGRELATLVMLGSIAEMLGRNRWTKFAYFSFLFGVWDIIYYVGLYVLLGWPPSLFTWDILFSIPVSWASPVIAPVLVSILLIAFSCLIFFLSEKGYSIKTTFLEKTALFGGFLVIFLSMTIDGFRELTYYLHTPTENLSFNWWLFWAGMVITLLGVVQITAKGFKFIRNSG